MSPHHTDSIKRLFQALLLLQSEEECSAFLEDLCTIRELQDLSQRLEVAEMLGTGKNYQEISNIIKDVLFFCFLTPRIRYL